ncbi:class I SAM-dependent methyltransferase [Lachnospiraceae bacterium 62-35]
MRNTAAELVELWESYKGNIEELLSTEKKLPYLYALSKTRENLLEWFPFEKGGRLLQAGADCGALTGMLTAKGLRVTVMDSCKDELEFVQKRYEGKGENPDGGSITYIQGSLAEAGETMKGEKGRFEYITMIGSLAEEKEAAKIQLKNAKRLLAPGGFLFIAVDNPAGVKHWAGAPREKNAIGKRRLERLLEKGKRGEWFMYYPFPDYKLPTEIYSDRWLPEKGDLSGTVISYDYPEFLKADVGASYDMICEEGQFPEFANSFLAVWKKGGKEI